MGFSSYDCKHCGHPALSRYSSDPEINEWMVNVVVMTSNGTRLVGEHDGYSGVGGACVADGGIPMDGAVWVHQACWEVAGKPSFDDYMVVNTESRMFRRQDRRVFNVVTHDAGAEKVVLVSRPRRGESEEEREQVDATKVAEGWYVSEGGDKFEVLTGSRSSADQGYFFNKEHDMIDPRITDEAERERLLAEGVEKREQRWYGHRAEKVAEWLDPDEREYHPEEKQKEPWRHRFSYNSAYNDGNKLENEWWLRDEFGPEHGGLEVEDADGELLTWKGTEEECKAHLASLWAQFVESDEAKAYIAHRAEQRRQYRLEAYEQLKKKGRFEVGYGPAPEGDRVKDSEDDPRPWRGGRTIFRVEDRLTYETVEVMDGPDKALGVKTFIRDPDYDGNNSAEWEARVEDIRAATRESRELAEELVELLNKQWADEGYPVPEDYGI